MPVIPPVSDPRDKTPKIEEIRINEQTEQALIGLYQKLDEAEKQSQSGQTRVFREAMTDLRRRFKKK